MKSNKIKRYGFTIVELLVVIVVIGILAAGETVYVDNVMITKTPHPSNYRDGSSDGWQWTGSANQSKSIGPNL